MINYSTILNYSKDYNHIPLSKCMENHLNNKDKKEDDNNANDNEWKGILGRIHQ